MPRHWSEGVARSYLESRGYTVVAQNYRLRGGELDLVAQTGETLVFVEVKQRKSDHYGSAAEAIGPAKVARLRRAALFYLMAHYGREDVPVRFDAVLVSGRQESYKLEHLQGVF